jgi:two-component system chemotaxis response regulator CheB
VTNLERLRVLVVDDSPVDRHVLARLLTREPGIELVGSASNGAEAVRKVARLRPDVVTLDDHMPIMGGLDAARHIMRDTPTPIVMISAATGDDARSLADEAAAAGVLAVRPKQALSTDPAAATELVRVIRGMAAVRLVRRRREPVHEKDRKRVIRAGVPQHDALMPAVVAIGASTGGPHALRQILGGLPADFPLPVLVVQHTTAGYSNTLVEWLSSAAAMRVGIAHDGEVLEGGCVYLAPAGRHMVVQGRRIAFLDDAPVSLHCPSATTLFRSIAATYGGHAIGVLLTGMGDDGAAGLAEMKRVGALTIAQDECSSVVFGMPAEAIRLGAVDQVVPIEDIADVILGQLAARGGTKWT